MMRATAPLLLLLLGTSSIHHNASAFAPVHAPAHSNHIQIINNKDRDEQRGFLTTQIWAQKNRKVPQMPTLPVASYKHRGASSPSSSSSSNHFYSTSKTISTPMVVMDVENIRGATSFRISHEALLSRIRMWREDRLSIASTSAYSYDENNDYNNLLLEPLIWVCDHGMSSSIHHFSIFPNHNDGNSVIKLPHNFGAIFAGEGQTADDVIVNLVHLRCGGIPSYHIKDIDDDNSSFYLDESNLQTSHPDDTNLTRNTTIIITADARLISRCQQARRQSSSLSDVIFVEPASLLQQLERYRINSHEEESLFGELVPQASTDHITAPSTQTNTDGGGKRGDGKTSTMTSFKDSSVAAQQHAKFQARFQNNESPPQIAVTQQEDTANYSNQEDDKSAAIAAQLKTEQIRRQMLLSDAYYLARPSRSRGRKSQSTMAAVHAKYKNRNISKTQQKKMYEKRFGKKRKEEAISAAMKRKELAAKLQLNLERASIERLDDEEAIIDQSRSVRGGVELLEMLLGWFEKRHSMIGKKEIPPSLQKAKKKVPTNLLGLTGQVGADDKYDPLGAVVHVPLRGGQVQSNSSNNVAPIRMVVISDTHGFEGGLSKFGSSEENGHSRSSDFLLPHADVLLHCGDFAASGSRKTQRAAARCLDEFLARQTHIPEKIIVQGNHDPDSPAKVLFPNSKAIYVRASSTITVNGVHLAIEPFSRRMAYRNIRAASSFPKCDILVSHEPPKHILDLTYHGFSAGSFYLKDLVEKAEHKPRLWLCGHIHESRGIVTTQFQLNDAKQIECESTIVINASNANSGRANRIVSGAVVVEVERLSSNINEYKSAESTLQIRKVDEYDYFASSPPDLTITGMDGVELNEWSSRPGVRRRKGLPLSVRQQMKQVRSTLLQSQNQNA